MALSFLLIPSYFFYSSFASTLIAIAITIPILFAPSSHHNIGMIVVIMAMSFAFMKGVELFQKESIVLLYGHTSTVPLLFDRESFECQNPMYEERGRGDGFNSDRNINDNNSKSNYNISNFGSPGNGEETDGSNVGGAGGGENKEGIDGSFEETNPMCVLEGSPMTPQSRKVCLTTSVSPPLITSVSPSPSPSPPIHLTRPVLLYPMSCPYSSTSFSRTTTALKS
jgi:hypothetical protein